MTCRTLPFSLVDVFSREALAGNGLSIFLLEDELSGEMMQKITQEMRQFETIFLHRTERTSGFRARIFTMEEELPFAGHPLIGAAAMLHVRLFSHNDVADLEFVMAERSIRVTSYRENQSFFAEMDQGIAKIEPPIPTSIGREFLSALNLEEGDQVTGLPLQVISTGLPYLIVPVTSNLARARITAPNFETLLARVGAKFVYVLDVERLEGRTWDNNGRVEDIATGSAAGSAAAYLATHGRITPGCRIVLSQGRFLNRPSEISILVEGDTELNVRVRGQVCFTGSGALTLPF